jgi:hypothetical protein
MTIDILGWLLYAAMLYAGYRALLHVWAEEGQHRIESRVVPISALDDGTPDEAHGYEESLQ